MHALLKFSINYPKLIIGLIFLVTVGICLNLSGLTIKSSNLDLIDQENPEVIKFMDFSRDFGTPNNLVVALEGANDSTLREIIPQLQSKVEKISGVRKVISQTLDPESLSASVPIYNFLHSKDQKIYYLFVQPEDIRTDVTLMTPLVQKVEEVLSEIKNVHPNLSVGLTGIPKYALDDQTVISHDVNYLSWISLALVMLLYVIAFKSFWHPMLATLVVLVAVILTLGVAMVFPGHLTLLSAPFAMMIFGIGTDFGIHLINRYEELLEEKLSNYEAIYRAGKELSKTLLATCGTTAAGFYVLWFSGFQGFQELGVIAGTGMIISLIMMYTLLPAAILFIKAPKHQEHVKESKISLSRFCSTKFAWYLAGLLLILSIVSIFTPKPGFNSDYLSLQPKNSEAVRLERQMVTGSDFSPYFAAFTANSLAESVEITNKLRESSTVGNIKSLSDFLPPNTPPEALATLPAELQEIFISKQQKFAIYAYPLNNIWDQKFEAEFLNEMRSISQQVTGMPFLGNTMMEQTKEALRVTTMLAMLTLLIILIIDLKRPLLILLATAVPIISMTGTQAFMLYLGIRFNPLNIMALPIIVGVSIDHAIHIIHRFQEENGNLAKTMSGAGRSVVLTNLTTLAAFGALAFTSHEGLKSFSLMLCAGVVIALILSILVLPQILKTFKSKFLILK